MKWKEELEIFLGGTFHQDIESPETAVREYSILWKDSLVDLTGAIDDFMKADLTMDEKNKFIKNNTEIYFPAIQKSPIEWLNEINMFFKEEMLK
ncbi:TPA: hypothetical protein PTV44_000010 [Clostridium botulinum]|uniref:contact-dependent growth inhibition system immunity protein n=1 Tax=Clostridium TaxID=1485 RepID=UPI002237F89D|nr:contact-dependent growth inhibition system immunity protein [Clostridium sporogenes]MCW6076143.1 hypothetical protein [Clostridium sporogenes]HDK7166208.1 hypothetical protein [Clostridium botulinum]